MAQAYRCTLEVLKWLAPRQVLVSCSVSALWKSACEAEELWREMMQHADFSQDEVGEELGSTKLCYREIVRLREKKVCFIPNYNRSSVRVFSCLCRKVSRTMNIPLHTFPINSAVIVLSHKEAFVCGGGTCLEDSTKSVNLLTGEVTVLAPMTTRRTSHSAVFAHNAVYAFGGMNSHTAEKYPMVHKAWQQIGDMHSERSSFNASCWGNSVYLCGGHTRECELFDLDSEQFSVLALRLNQSNWTVSFFYQRELVVISGSEIYFLKQGQVEVKHCAMKLIPFSNMTPVVHREKVFISMFSCEKVLAVDLPSLTSVEYS